MAVQLLGFTNRIGWIILSMQKIIWFLLLKLSLRICKPFLTMEQTDDQHTRNNERGTTRVSDLKRAI